MRRKGFIKLDRKITEWKWYDDIPTTRLFIHLLLTCNFESKDWHGEKIPRGSKATSIRNLAEETGLTERQIRTAIDHLLETEEITIAPTHRHTLINVVNYRAYQDSENKNDTVPTQQTTQQTTQYRHTATKTTKGLDGFEQPKATQQTTQQTTTTKEYIYSNNNKELIVNNKLIKGTSKYNKQIFFDDPELDTTFKEYLDTRTKMKVPNTDRAIQLLINKLKGYTKEQQMRMIETSIERGWKSLYPPKDTNVSFLDL